MIYILLIICQFMRPLETCSEGFCLDFSTKATEDNWIDLGKDKISGCNCKQQSDEYLVCFGRATCLSFPKTLNFTTKIMLLKNSQLLHIEPGDLDKLQNVETLKLDGNFNLTEIRSGSFRNLISLKNLSISYNANLRFLGNGSLDGLGSLRNLILVKNGFNSLKSVTPALTNLPKLRKLDLSENVFQIIEENDFQVLETSSLEELNLILCQIIEIVPTALHFLTNLKMLRLGENNFDSMIIARVIEESSHRTSLKLLNLYGIGLKKSAFRPLLEAIAKTNISSLNLSRNQFETITSETFPKMPNLQILDLRDCLILNITNDAFIGLHNLKRLFLSDNKLASFPEGVHLQQLTFLDLQQNSASSSYFSLYGQKFQNMKNLQELNLSFNILHVLYNHSLMGLENLRILGLKNATIYRIENNTFANLPNLIFLNLENNFFMKNDPQVIEKGLFWKLKNLQVLLLGGCGINSITPKAFRNLKQLRHLSLERNHLLSVPDFQFLLNLQTIDLSGNRLSAWQQPVFTKNHQLQVIKINDNKFSTISQAMKDDFKNLKQLDFSGNSLICDCFTPWKSVKILKLLKTQPISCSTNGMTVEEFLKSNQQCHDISLIICLVCFFLIAIMLISMIYYYRWHLRYWLFLTNLHLRRNHKIKTTSRTYTNYLYDAFVSYASEDQHFVLNLISKLEDHPPFIKLCVYERDFEIGTIISENILLSFAKSRKTLLIISNSYVKSQWCRWESHLAEHHRLFCKNENGEFIDDSLIVIKLEDVKDHHMTPTLRYLLKTRIYLQWETDEKKQKLFWEKLREVLKPPIEVNEK